MGGGSGLSITLTVTDFIVQNEKLLGSLVVFEMSVFKVGSSFLVL